MTKPRAPRHADCPPSADTPVFASTAEELRPEHSTKRSMEAELTEWWLDLARAEAAKVVPKAVEYGATDLLEIGRDMVAAGVAERGGGAAELCELGVYFYMVGKMARWRSAVAEGRAVGDDTLHDIGVYVRMAQRIRSHGGWPATEDG